MTERLTGPPGPPVSDQPLLGKLIRRHRIAAGLSQEELAERSNVSPRTVSDLERGQRATARLETVRMLAAGLALRDDERAELLAAARPELAPPADIRRDGARQSLKTTTLPLRLQPPPVPITGLIGRDEELAQTVQLLTTSSARLVTLIGPGGVGKTRLSLAIAEQVALFFADGIAFIDLSALQASYLVPGTIASGLGLAVEPDASPLAAIRAALRNRSLLIVLDNFEHLLDAATIISDLLAACPSLKALVTSRARLHLRGEHLLHVSPLAVPARRTDRHSVEELSANPSVQLFLERAREIDLHFSLNGQNAEDVAEICRRLDGLPLAIELASSRTALYSPEALLARLEPRLPALTGGPRDSPARQRTLRDTIAWSYDLLRQPERAVFRRLAVAVGGFTLDAAEAIADSPDIDVPAAIETLVSSSLLTPMRRNAPERRFTMLDTVHEFAASLLEEAGEAHSTRRRHADWCLRLAETAGGELLQCRDESIWFRRLDADQPNIRAAIDFLLETGDGESVVRLLASPWSYWTERPYPHDLRRWLEPALGMTREAPDHPTILALGLLINATSFLGEHETAAAIASRQLQMAETIGTPLALGLAWFWQGITTDYAGDVERATISFERALGFNRAAGCVLPILESMLEVGSISLIAGKVEQAEAILDEGVTVAREAGSDTELAYGLLYRGFAALARNTPALAARSFEEGLLLAQRFQMDRVTLGAIGGFAGVTLVHGQQEVAARLLGAVDAARQSSGVGRICQASQVDIVTRKAVELLGQQAFDACAREGSGMSYQEAIDTALAVAGAAK